MKKFDFGGKTARFLMLIGLFLLISPLVLSFSLKAKEIQASSKITQVTVFLRSALVSRLAKVNLAPGLNKVVFPDLPVSLNDNSLTVEGEGNSAVKILNLEVARTFATTPYQEEVKRLEEKIKELDREIAQSEEILNICGTKEKFLQSLAAGSSSEAWKQIIIGPNPKFDNWKKTLDFLGKELKTIAQEKLATQEKLAQLKEERQTLKKKLEEIKPHQPREAKRVSLLLTADREGEVNLHLSYLIPQATWMPRYTLRALPQENKVEVAVFGAVRQKSGENWEGVSLELATTLPTAGVSPPQLNPWYIDLYTPPPAPIRTKRTKQEIKGRVVGGVLGGVAPEKADFQKVALQTALIEEKGLHLNFKVPQLVSIPSDNQLHSVPIDSQELEAEFDYYLVPKNMEAAFLRASLKNTFQYPLLKGPAYFFIEKEYIGQGTLNFLAPGDKGNLYFGRDKQIQVKYTQVSRKKIEPGFLSKTEKIKFGYEITLENFRPREVKLEIVDQLPVSRNSKITIDDVALRPQPDKQEKNGLLHWKLTLSPGTKKKISINFTLSYPQGSHLVGL